jgi:hypothetical protein
MGEAVRWDRFRKVSVSLGTAPTNRFVKRLSCKLLEMLRITEFDKDDKAGYVLVRSEKEQ